MAKRTTSKAEREAAEKAAIRRRLKDMAIGAYGGYSQPDWEAEDFVGMANEMGLDAFGRWVGAIRVAWIEKDREWVTDYQNLEHFDTLDKATEFLWENGVRA
jgi:hypothetical protein